MADFSELLSDDIWYFIGQKFEDAADRIRFRSVCRRWRSIRPFPQPPWLMLAEDDHTPNTRGFFGLGQSQQQNGVDEEKQEVYQFQLPEAYRTRCLGSTGTWLVSVDLHERIFLLNPFSRVQIDLPSQTTLEFRLPLDQPDLGLTPEDFRNGNTYKAIISSPPSAGRDCLVVIIFYYMRKLAYARPGDAVWTTIPNPTDWFQDIIFYQNQIYGVNMRGDLIVCSVGDDSNPPTSALLYGGYPSKGVDREPNEKYLVEWMGELLWVIKFIQYDDLDDLIYGVNRFEIYKFDFAKKEWNSLNNLGEYSLFLGFNTSIALLASQYPGLKKNCIYYTEDHRLGILNGMVHDKSAGMLSGVLDLDDNSIQPHYKGISTSLYSPPLWIIPQIHH